MTVRRHTTSIPALIMIPALLLILAPQAHSTADPDYEVQSLLRDVRTKEPPAVPKESIYSRNDILFCTGESPAALLNNEAARSLESGDYTKAKETFVRGLRRAPLFFPYLYNIGICCLYLREYDQGLIYLDRARNVLPEFPKTYLQMGYIHEMKGDPDGAIQHFRRALEVNQKELNSYILIGDIYYNRNQIKMAEKYYRESLRIDPRYANGLIGVAKIHFFRKEYHSCIVVIKSIERGTEYDKALHYYYAESAYKMQDYQTAHEQYTELLKYRADKFFITHPRSLIQHKLDLAARFIGQ